MRGLLLGGGLLLAAGPALAHAHLHSSQPAADAVLAAAPAELQVALTEPLEPRFSALELRDAAGQAIALPPPRLAEGDTKRLVVSLPPLQPGRYTVLWRVTSVDTHRTEGRFAFTIRQP
ncbi:copper resistance protein CopC [Roseomonas aerophila]|uniref:Copper resistance protein CopC n=2 Tax=Teichococcus aerophilus TaxID=1224513 RepID=A0ABR7RGV0_9PROT|nr:copper resistance protein CopC [Pseudoroseomonas aerophila]